MAASPSRVPSFDLLRALQRGVSTAYLPSTTTPRSQARISTTISTKQRPSSSFSSSSSSSSFPPDRRSFHTSFNSRASASSTQSQTSTVIPGGQSPSAVSRHKINPNAPRSRDRGPTSTEDTQTDFGLMDIYGNTPEPATSIDACTPGGFHLNNGTKITGGTGALLAGGEAWSWRPWMAAASSQSEPRISDLLDKLGRLSIPPASLFLLKLLHPKPDLMFVGTGSKTLMLAPGTRQYLTEELGLRLEVMDTANASAAYNLLAKERGVEGGAGIGGIMLPVGWKGTK